MIVVLIAEEVRGSPPNPGGFGEGRGVEGLRGVVGPLERVVGGELPLLVP